MLRSAVQSAFWSALNFRKKNDGMSQNELAKKLDADKSIISRWFSGDPNWELNTISDIADALDVDVEFHLKDRRSTAIFTPSGVAFHADIKLLATAPSVMQIISPANVKFEKAAA